MKSTLQSIALLSAAILISGCDNSSDGGATGAPAQNLQVGVSGSAVKGIIDGATVEVFDASGDLLVSRNVVNGDYSVVFEQAAIDAGIDTPLTVTITGGTSLCDYDNPDPLQPAGNDCPTGDVAVPFVAFGEPYSLGATFTLNSIADADITGQSLNFSNASPASEIALQKAVEKAAGAAISVLAAQEANQAVAGLIELISGISLGGLDVSQIRTADLTATGGTPSDAELALAALASGVIGSQGATETLTDTIARLAALFTIDADGNAVATGADLALFTDSIARGLAVAAAKQPSGALTNAIANVSAQAAIFRSIGTGLVKIGPPAEPGSTAPVDQTKAFVIKLGAVIGEVAGSTGAQGFGGQNNTGATEAFAAELDAVAAVSSGNATKAFTRLSAALIAAATGLEAGTSITNAAGTDAGAEDGLTFVLTADSAGALTATGISSTWPLEEATGGNTVTLTADTASADGETTVDIPVVTLTTTSGTATLQTFVGSLSFTTDTTATETAPNGIGAGSLSGTITGATSGVSYTIDAVVADIPLGIDDGGTYELTFGFNSPAAKNLSLKFEGVVGAAAQTFTVTAPAGSIVGTVTRTGNTDVNTLSDGTTTLTLTVTDGDVVSTEGVIGSFSVGTGENKVTTASLGDEGGVTYEDGSIQSLPAIIFPDPQSQ